MFRAALKSLLARKVRLALTALSIVLGVGFMAGTFVLTDTTIKAFDDLIVKGTSAVDGIVRSTAGYMPGQGQGPGGCTSVEPIDESIVDDVRAVAGVGAAEGVVRGYAQLVDPATGDAIGSFGPPTCGESWNELGPYSIREGSTPTGPNDVVIDVDTAEKYGLTVGQIDPILFQQGRGEFTVVGLAGYAEEDSSFGGATLAFFDVETAQERMDRAGRFDEIHVVAAEGEDAATVLERIRPVLPQGVEVATSETVADEAQQEVAEGLGFVRTGLLVFAFVALFVGAFTIFNTFSIVVAQRTRELALLRTLGASRPQVTWSVLAEAALVGLFAAVLGILLGILIAIGLRSILGATLFEIPSTPLQIVPRTIVVSLIAGVLVTILSAILPARSAASVAPLQALRDAQTSASRSLGRRVVIGSTVLAIGAAALLYGLFGGPPQPATYVGIGAAVSFIGVAMLTPLIARPLAATLGSPFRALTGRLGRENAMRNPRRTAATASALMIGVGLVGFVTIFASSLKASTTEALASTLRADFIVTSSTFAPFSTGVARAIREVEGVDAVSEIRQAAFRLEGTDQFLSSVDPSTIEVVTDIELESGRVAALEQGQLLVHRNVAEDRGWSVGATVNVAFPATGTHTITVGGIYGENRLVGDYVSSLEVYAENSPDELDTFVLVKAMSGVEPAQLNGELVSAVEPFPGIDVQDQAAFREKQAGLIDSILQLVQVLLALALLIALFGIINTLSLSIYERTREIGLLRAVGMDRRQVRGMIRKEAVIISVMGALFGLVIGVLFGWAMQQAFAESGITELSIPFGQLLTYMVIAGVLGVVAAIGPARRAAKLDVLQAISYE